MHKQRKTKLQLNRETMRVLDPKTLATLQGGYYHECDPPSVALTDCSDCPTCPH